MNGRVLGIDTGFFGGRPEIEAPLIEALKRERRHAAVVFLSTGVALGIGFSLAIDMALATVARL